MHRVLLSTLRGPRRMRAQQQALVTIAMGLVYALLLCAPAVASNLPTIVIGLDADMSGPSAESGVAIQRGAELAISEINAAGGILGRHLELVVKDHRGNPARGLDNIKTLAEMPNLAAVLAGKHSPVALRQLDAIHHYKVPFLVPWAAATSLVHNGRDPNYVFRVSVRDEDAGAFFVDEAIRRGFQRPALILERTPWGRSNDKALNNALKKRGLSHVGVIWMNRGDRDTTALVREAKQRGADVVIMVASTNEAALLVQSMASFPADDRLPIISHWSVTGGVFFEKTRPILTEVDLTFLQTHSFLAPRHPARSESLVQAYQQRYGAPDGARSLVAPVGIAHAYDLVHLLAKAIDEAKSISGPQVQKALLGIKYHKGLLRDYAPPFTLERQDALTRNDFILGRYASDGAIIPQGFQVATP